MKKVQILSNYVKTHKLISLGVAASTVALVATGIGTYSYFSDSKTANTNLTLNKGTVKLGDFGNNKWQYVENISDKTVSDISTLSLPDARTYAGKTINSDLIAYSTATDTTGKTLDDFTKETSRDSSATSAALEGEKFANIVPGDTFRKTYELEYTGTNSAEIILNLIWGTKDTGTWTKFDNTYNYIVKYSVDDNKADTTDTEYVLISNYTTGKANYSTLTSNNGYTLKDSNDKPVLIKKGNKLHLYVTVGMKATDYDASTQANVPDTVQSLGGDSFNVTVKNHLETKTNTSTTTASN